MLEEGACYVFQKFQHYSPTMSPMYLHQALLVCLPGSVGVRNYCFEISPDNASDERETLANITRAYRTVVTNTLISPIFKFRYLATVNSRLADTPSKSSPPPGESYTGLTEKDSRYCGLLLLP